MTSHQGTDPLRLTSLPGTGEAVMSWGRPACWGAWTAGVRGQTAQPGTQGLADPPCSRLPRLRGDRVPASPALGGINLKQLIASERSHQRLNKHNLTEGMIIDLVKKRGKKEN